MATKKKIARKRARPHASTPAGGRHYSERAPLTPSQQTRVASARHTNLTPSRRSELAQWLLGQLVTHQRISPGQRIGVAVSGGADSVALLRLLLEVREQIGVVLSVVHFNHHLRGAASDADEKFVAKLAVQHNLPFFVAQEDIAATAKQLRANVEETARKSRYAFFERLAAEGNLDRVAVAHTADDQAETVLSHMLRGTGIAGLGGIHPEAGVVFRPLLRFRRGELRVYLRSFGQKWREDATNRDITRTRARIRRKLIPFLEEEFQPAVVEHLCRLAELAREDNAWLDSSAELRVFLGAKEENGAWRVAIRELIGAPGENSIGYGDDSWASASRTGRKTCRYANEDSSRFASGNDTPSDRAGLKPGLYANHAVEAMSKRMIRLLVKRVKPRAGQLGVAHVEQVLRLAGLPDSGKSLHLPGGVEVRRERDSIAFRPMGTRGGASDSGSRGFAHPLDLSAGQAELRLVEHSWVLRFQVIDWPLQGRETRRTGAVLDRDKLGGPLVVRNWRAGDAMKPVGHQKSHALSRLLNEAGVSRWEKEFWPVLTSAGKIAWTRGLPVAAEFAAGGSTQKGVVITEVPLA